MLVRVGRPCLSGSNITWTTQGKVRTKYASCINIQALCKRSMQTRVPPAWFWQFPGNGNLIYFSVALYGRGVQWRLLQSLLEAGNYLLQETKNCQQIAVDFRANTSAPKKNKTKWTTLVRLMCLVRIVQLYRKLSKWSTFVFTLSQYLLLLYFELVSLSSSVL